MAESYSLVGFMASLLFEFVFAFVVSAWTDRAGTWTLAWSGELSLMTKLRCFLWTQVSTLFCGFSTTGVSAQAADCLSGSFEICAESSAYKHWLALSHSAMARAGQCEGKAEKDCSLGEVFDKLMRCRRWSCHASQLPGASVAVLCADQRAR